MSLRCIIRTTVLLCLVPLSGAMAHAQRGGGQGGGGMQGGGMGGSSFMSSRGGRGDMSQPMMQPHTHAEPVIALPGRWWDDRGTAKTLKLRPEQQERMDDAFNANRQTLVTLYSNLQHEQQKFVQMPREDLADETKVFAQIDRIAQARAELEKANFHTLMQVRKEMTPEQLAALDKAIASSTQGQ